MNFLVLIKLKFGDSVRTKIFNEIDLHVIGILRIFKSVAKVDFKLYELEPN